MKFWDASAIIPLCLEEENSGTLQRIAEEDSALAVWWGTLIECFSTIARLRREKIVSMEEEQAIRKNVMILSNLWTEILPGHELRITAANILLRHPLRAADAFQLAAALVWADRNPTDDYFVSLDTRLNQSALQEGFSVLP